MNRTYAQSFLNTLFWFPILVLTCLLSFNALHYYTFSFDYGILPEKLVAREDKLWLVCFYFHMLSGVVCLFAPLLLFCRKQFRIPASAHRKIGKVYIITTLLIVVPTGFYMSVYAKGGLTSQLGFVAQGILLFIFTWSAFKLVLKKEYQKHAKMMVRGYAVVAAALTFRLYHMWFYYLDIPYEINYAASQWISIIGNLFIAESIITIKHYNQSKFNF
ncbi:MAG: hypothetical protein ACJA0Q_002196 [Saprospiraceae bacterium]|jgi:hypothetical protein